MKSDVRRILIAMVLPMFLIFILYTIKVLEVGMDWDFTRLGVYPLSKKGMFGIFAASSYTQWLQTFTGQHFTSILPFMVSFLLLQEHCTSDFFYHLDRMRNHHVPYR